MGVFTGGPFADIEAFVAWLDDCASATDHVFYVVRQTEQGHLAGMASYLDIQPAMGVIEIGYIWFVPFIQKTPAATKALFLMLCYAMDDLKYRRMQWRCNALNDKSRNAALRLGFTYEGIFYNHMVVKECNRETAWYSITDSEWPALRANLVAWLSPDNFDQNGEQKTALSELNARRAKNKT